MQVQTENCALLGYYAARSGNFLPTFRDNISVSSSGFKNQSAVLSYLAAHAWNHAKFTLILRLYISATHLWFNETKLFLVRWAKTWLRRLWSDFPAEAGAVFQVSPGRICCVLNALGQDFLRLVWYSRDRNHSIKHQNSYPFSHHRTYNLSKWQHR